MSTKKKPAGAALVAAPTPKAAVAIPKPLLEIGSYLNVLGTALQTFDEDTDGSDDKTGLFLVWSSDLISAIAEEADLPELPEVLKTKVGKLSSKARLWLVIATTGIAATESKVTGSARKVLRYLKQGLMALSANQPVPPVPNF